MNDFETSRQEQIDRAIAEYLMAVDAGQRLDRERWLDSHPDVRDELEQFLANDDSARRSLAPETAGPDHLDPDMTTDFTPGGDSTGQIIHSRGNRLPPRSIGGYQLLKLLGTGGMGQVYEAIDSNGHHVAIKILSPEWSQSDEAMQRFRQEGEIASRIHHPRCVFVKAADDDAGKPFIVMELMSGRTLKDVVVENSRMPVKKGLAAIDDVLAGMEEAHEHGLIHRDVKPANCYVEASGRIKLGDFGLSRSLIADGSLTRTGSFLGTPLFASPEQVRGEKLDQRTDIYSAAATLYYLLVGHAPFSDDSATRVIARIVSENPASPRSLNSEITPALEQVILKGLARDPEKRFQTATEFREAIAPFISGGQTIGRLGRRIAAYAVDSLVFVLFGVLFGFCFGLSRNAIFVPDVSFYLGMITPYAIYFLVCELIWGMTPGKAIFGQKVVDSQTRLKPPAWRILIRTIAFVLLGGVATDLILITTSTAGESPATFYLLQSAGYLFSALLVIGSLILTQGRYLLHDLFSGTIVIDSRTSFAMAKLVRREGWQLPLKNSSKWPEKIGKYVVRGELHLSCQSEQTDTINWLLAEDRVLQRIVWLCIQSPKALPIPARRREINRTARMRWIDGGCDNGYRWDAFALPLGVAPLTAWNCDSERTWSAVAQTIHEMGDEFQHSSQDGEPEGMWHSPEQFWINSSGRVCLIETTFPEESHYRLREQQSSESDETKRQLFSQVARQLLESPDSTESSGNSADSAGSTIRAIVPLAARRALDQLGDSSSFDIDKFRTALAAAKQSSPVVDRGMRTISVAIGATTLTIFFLLMLSLPRIGHQVTMHRLQDRVVIVATLAWLAESDERFVEMSTRLPELAQFERVAVERAATDSIPGLLASYEQRVADTPQFLRAALRSYKIGIDDPEKRLNNLVFKVSQTPEYSIDVEGWLDDGSPQTIDSEDLSGAFVPPIEGSAKPKIDFECHVNFWPLLLTVLAMPMAICLWGGLTGGGMMWWFSGLRLVDNDGRPARWWQSLLRSIMVWALPIGLLTLLLYLDLRRPEQQVAIQTLARILLYLPLLWAAIAVAFPRRPIQDWLLGTCIIPK